MSRRKPVAKITGYKPVRIVPRSDNQKLYMEMIADNDITFASGPAGCGKTHIAAAMAVKMLKMSQVDKICICRPVVGVGKDIGYLPGTMEEKVGPYLTPLFDELCYYMERSKLKELMANDILEIVPLSMMRGRTFNDSFVILDEAQNATLPELRMFLTRIGKDAKLVVTGDLLQSDLPVQFQGAFKASMRSLEGIKGIGIIKMEDIDIVRHVLISEIEKRLPREISCS